MRPATGRKGNGGVARRESINAIRLTRVLELKIWTGYTNKIANFRGTAQRRGNRAKQRTKQAKAAKLHAPKTSSLSHLLTNTQEEVSVKSCH
jgi:hypothetical protein